jgi:predicted GNAT family acetyltransferase
MHIDLDSVTVVNNVSENRFEVIEGEYVAVIDYLRKDGDIAFIHTGVPEALSGQGLAGKMANVALEYAKSEGLSVLPRCPFVRAYIRRHPEYQELVSERYRE